MALSKRAYAVVTAVLGFVLSGVVVQDMLVDWLVEDKPFWSTVSENSLPLVLALGIIVGGYWLYLNRSRRYVEAVARWQLLGTVGLFSLVGWVLAVQTVQGELKPVVILFQTTIGGAVAGSLVGYANARTGETLADAKTQRDRFEALFENAPAQIVDVEFEAGELRARRANSAFEEEFATVEDGQPLTALVEHEEEIDGTIRTHVESNDPLETDVSVDTHGGSGYFQLRVAPHGDQQAYLIYLDVTEMKDTQRDLERTVTRLERSNERLEEFAYIASHDLQEPLRTVSRYAELIDEEYGDELDEAARDYLDTVVTGAERMSSMVNGLLDYSRVTTRGGEFEPVDTEQLVEKVAQDLNVLRAEENGTISVGSLPTVSADRDQLWQVFQNLIKNALEHSGDAPVEISITATEQQDQYRFVVEDDGPGVDPYMEDDIFNMFESGQNYQTQGDAKGIGLAVVERIIDRHDGDIWVESEPGKGSRFFFTLQKA